MQYKPRAQLTTFFEDDTADADDDLLQRVIVTQGPNVIFDSGIVDFGLAGPIAYPVDVALCDDVNFGFWPGAEIGPNNSNCTPDIASPLAAPTFPGVIYQVAGGSTRQRPVPGKAPVGMRIVQCVNSLRIARAQDLLSKTQLPMEHVAERTGFGSVRQFPLGR